MNLLDMYTREKANKIHIEKLQRDRRYHKLLRSMHLTRSAAISKRIRLMLIFATLTILFGALLITSINGY